MCVCTIRLSTSFLSCSAKHHCWLSYPLQAAVKVAVVFLTLALVLVIAPVKYVVSALHLGLFAFTLRDKTTENRLVRRLRELWHTIPPISVRMIESDGLKTQKG
ncbi:hypothetical protein L7F22_057464 [Adiantum nelumboides]|nr:hypothetical protein [Adiantum nelumboides]